METQKDRDMEKVAQMVLAIVAIFWTLAIVFFPEGVGYMLYTIDETRYPSYICE